MDIITSKTPRHFFFLLPSCSITYSLQENLNEKILILKKLFHIRQTNTYCPPLKKKKNACQKKKKIFVPPFPSIPM